MFKFFKSKKSKKDEQPEAVSIADSGDAQGRLKKGLGKTSSRFGEAMKNIFVRKKLDDSSLQDLEDLLIMSDMGVRAAGGIVAEIAKNKFDKEVSDVEVKEFLAGQIAEILRPVEGSIDIDESNKPHVILFCGVNGTGKTTTIGKLAKRFSDSGKTVMVAACDTFRAAATEQLEVWSKRAGCQFVKGELDADPASVAYEALKQAKAENIDVLMIDTAGRLQNKHNLMEQLVKVKNVIKKIDDSAPHSNIIVLDATTGQNAVSQVKVFREMVEVDAMVVTKLDGSARGGIVVGLANDFALPVCAIGVGESIEDLQAFDPEGFARAVVGL